MTDDFRTIADPTILEAEGALAKERALLMVYFTDQNGVRTQLVEVPDGAEVTFGRTRSATVHIDSERVSRNHARLERRGREFAIADLGSRNGTRVNGARIEGERSIASGDEIVIGPATAVLSVVSRARRHTLLGGTSYLEERLAGEADRGLRYQRPFALVMVRLEGSEEAADRAVDRMARILRPMDVMAEYGPDEIAVLLPELDLEAGREAGERLLTAAKQTEGGDRLTVRLGLAVLPTHGGQPGELISRARTALRSARSRSSDDVVTAVGVEDEPPGDSMVVVDPQMKRVYQLVRKVADTPMTVLIVGETGVGKEVVAEAVHRASSRKGRPFVRLNCACLPENLLESELFGHERGAFTGADRRKLGYFEAADCGTIFLDEIGEITPSLQAKLLRVLEEHKFTRVGGTQEIEVDVRVVCATNRDLEAAVARGAFREDLYFRISAFTIVVPPLRDRVSEVRPLAEFFVRQVASELKSSPPVLSDAAVRVLERHPWSGNVRELRNAMERAVVLQTSGSIDVDHLPDRMRGAAASAPLSMSAIPIGDGLDMREQIADVEKAALVAALDACGGNQTRAAQKLGLSRRALIYRMEKYGLKPKPRR